MIKSFLFLTGINLTFIILTGGWAGFWGHSYLFVGLITMAQMLYIIPMILICFKKELTEESFGVIGAAIITIAINALLALSSPPAGGYL